MSDYPSKDNNNQREREREWMVGRLWLWERCAAVLCLVRAGVLYTPIFMLSLVTTKPRVPEQNFSFHILILVMGSQGWRQSTNGRAEQAAGAAIDQ